MGRSPVDRANHRVLDALADYASRFGGRVLAYEEKGRVQEAVFLFPNPIRRDYALQGFKGIPGPVTVDAKKGTERATAVFAWLARRG